MDRTRSDYTAYPKLFRKTYWGQGSAEATRSLHHPSIIENRNRFAEDYFLKKVMTYTPTRKISRFVDMSRENLRFDHHEIYKTEGGQIIAISSPYGELSEDEEAKYIEAGWVQIDKLYCTSATTWLHPNATA